MHYLTNNPVHLTEHYERSCEPHSLSFNKFNAYDNLMEAGKRKLTT